jgi:hypothetical protein
VLYHFLPSLRSALEASFILLLQALRLLSECADLSGTLWANGCLHPIRPDRLVGAHLDALVPMQIVAGTAIVAVVQDLAVAAADSATVAVTTLGTADQALEQPACTTFPVSCALAVLVQLLLDGSKEFLAHQ